MADITVPREVPRWLITAAPTAPTEYDNGTEMRATPVRRLQRGAVHLGGGRKLVVPAGVRKWPVNNASTYSTFRRCSREAFTRTCRVHVRFESDGGTASLAMGTIKAITSLQTSTFKVPRGASPVEGVCTIDVQAGAGDNTDQGTVDVEIEVDCTGGPGATITIHSVFVEPLQKDEVTI